MTLLLLADAAVTDAITSVHLLLIAGFAALVVFAMIWGSVQKRRRRVAEDEAEDHKVAKAAPVASAPPPVAPPPPPPPPPLADPPASPQPAAVADVPLTRLKGLGPKAAALLTERGIGTIGALAALSDGEAQSIDGDLNAFSGRLSRDRWVEQARLLTAGDIAAYEKEFGKLG